ncbi:acyltransferase [Gramella sp. MT6]|uniref:acyltransferase family protein n=1 Tax=Gramella sp. MT6 TaxID=2705471 RepID=UPI001C60050D|nr:acyltransferase [Gramella sp. MT6]QYA27077.1 acyltransferase [Gramella sp. MT6]
MLKEIFFPQDGKPEHIKSLDGLRGMAVLFVVLAHGSEVTDRIDFILDFTYLGQLGVFIFFVLSAYLLDMQISKALINGLGNIQYWCNYFLRRFLRIFPLFFISLIVYYISYRFGFVTLNIIKYPSGILEHLTFQEAKAMYWSIRVEFQYYFISPLIVYLAFKLFRWKINHIKAFLVSIVLISTLYFQQLDFEYFRLVNYIPFFIIGSYLGIIDQLRFRPYSYDLLIPIILGLLITVDSIFPLLVVDRHYFNISFLTYAILIGLLMVLVKDSKGFFSKIFEWKILRYIGNISYSIYLFHCLFIFILHDYNLGSKYYNSIAYLALTILFSSLTYLLVEYPLSRVRLTTAKKLSQKNFSS